MIEKEKISKHELESKIAWVQNLPSFKKIYEYQRKMMGCFAPIYSNEYRPITIGISSDGTINLILILNPASEIRICTSNITYAGYTIDSDFRGDILDEDKWNSALKLVNFHSICNYYGLSLADLKRVRSNGMDPRIVLGFIRSGGFDAYNSRITTPEDARITMEFLFGRKRLNEIILDAQTLFVKEDIGYINNLLDGSDKLEVLLAAGYSKEEAVAIANSSDINIF